MIRAFVEELPKTGTFCLEGEEAFHLIKVKRIRPGETVEMLNGKGGRASCYVNEIKKRVVLLEVSDSQSESPDPPLGLVLGLPVQLSTLSTMLPGLVQVGVTHIYLVETEFSGRLRKADKAISRLDSILKQSLKQCGRSWLPEIQTLKLIDLVSTLDTSPFGHGHLFHPGGKPWSEIRDKLKMSSPIVSFIGPEGGFSPNDLETIESWNTESIDLGPSILKLETAAVCTLFRLKQELDSLQQ